MIDTIVRLVAERVEETFERYAQHSDDGRHHDDGHDDHDGRGEKEMIDLVVGLIAEHVQEIVAIELDRRLGPPSDEPNEEAEPDDRDPSPRKARKPAAKPGD